MTVAILSLVIFAVACSGGDDVRHATASERLDTLSSAQRDSVDVARERRIDEMYRGYHRDFSDVRDVTPDSLQAWLDRGEVVLVDVRKRSEIEVSRISGAITKDQYEEHRQDYEGRKIVPYCTIGYRSGKYAHRLNKEGVPAYNLAGGILAWAHDGGGMTDAHGSTKRVHVYGKQWNLLPVGWEAVW